MRNKKGQAFFQDETFKIIVAVACLIILFLVAYKMYGLFTTKTTIEQAKETMKQIFDESAALKEGQSKEFILQAPQGWALSSWPYTPDSQKVLMPNDCLKKEWKSCICLCEYPTRAEQIASLGEAMVKDSPAFLLLSGGSSLTNPLDILSAEGGVLKYCNNVGICLADKYDKFLVTTGVRDYPFPIILTQTISTKMSVRNNTLEIRKNE